MILHNVNNTAAIIASPNGVTLSITFTEFSGTDYQITNYLYGIERGDGFYNMKIQGELFGVVSSKNRRQIILQLNSLCNHCKSESDSEYKLVNRTYPDDPFLPGELVIEKVEREDNVPFQIGGDE